MAEQNDGNKHKKRVNTKPTLTVYGKVSELTGTVGRMSKGDGGAKAGMRK
jgi:hypothetical protein